MSFYSSASEVIVYTGVKAAHVGLSTRAELETLLEVWLTQIKDIIDADRNRDYGDSEAEAPEGINDIATRMCAVKIQNAKKQRTGAVLQGGDYDTSVKESTVFTEAITEDLKRYPRKPQFSITLSPGEDVTT